MAETAKQRAILNLAYGRTPIRLVRVSASILRRHLEYSRFADCVSNCERGPRNVYGSTRKLAHWALEKKSVRFQTFRFITTVPSNLSYQLWCLASPSIHM